MAQRKPLPTRSRLPWVYDITGSLGSDVLAVDLLTADCVEISVAPTMSLLRVSPSSRVLRDWGKPPPPVTLRTTRRELGDAPARGPQTQISDRQTGSARPASGVSQRADTRRATAGGSRISTCTPGSSRPSRNSSMAPPVERWFTRSCSPKRRSACAVLRLRRRWSRTSGDGVGDRTGARGELRELETAHWAVPEHGRRGRYPRRRTGPPSRADVEPHPAVGHVDFIQRARHRRLSSPHLASSRSPRSASRSVAPAAAPSAIRAGSTSSRGHSECPTLCPVPRETGSTFRHRCKRRRPGRGSADDADLVA